jgi:hypothetical protein
MSTEQERRRDELAGQLSQTLGAAAELMTPRVEAAGRAYPASAPGLAGRRVRRRPIIGRPPGRAGGRTHGLLVPLAAAAAVGALVVGSVAVSHARLGASRPSSATGEPAFYATLSESDTPVAEVHRTSDGSVTGTVPATPGWYPGDIAAAADDRTFYLAEGKIGNNSTGTCPSSRILEFGITSAGAVTGLHQVGVRVTGVISSLTASPDQTRLAYTTVCTTHASPLPDWVLHVMDLPSGTVSTWTSPAAATGTHALAWTADGRSLSFAYQWQSSQANFEDLSVVLVNTDSGSGTLTAHSRLIWHQNGHCEPGACVFDAWISPDGHSLTGEALGGPGAAKGGLLFSLERIALPSGQVSTVLFRTTAMGTGVGIPEPPAWADSSGTYWITTEGSSLGWVSDGRFHRMQATGSLQSVAW